MKISTYFFLVLFFFNAATRKFKVMYVAYITCL